MAASAVAASPGVIEPGVSYTLPEFAKRVGLGRHALRTARRSGLRIIYTAGRAYVRGDDWHAYLASQAGGRE